MKYDYLITYVLHDFTMNESKQIINRVFLENTEKINSYERIDEIEKELIRECGLTKGYILKIIWFYELNKKEA